MANQGFAPSHPSGITRSDDRVENMYYSLCVDNLLDNKVITRRSLIFESKN